MNANIGSIFWHWRVFCGWAAVKCLGREEAERAVGFDLGEIENRVWRTERLKALGNTIYPEVVLQVFGVIERLRTAEI